ncbi:uncharacterized protein (DUF2249 family) [Mesorhizobium sp. YL-MeA3-2017]|jgi:uncharacterized protein (DUF2249 family)|uniref:DUF2249 domain-containing protein n=1 Tax=Mesorhizobium sp. YL-MeA3-2017 TaxID=3042284 RepID=UPI0015CE8392|nr:DUF2249 domain-containing protein [Mesorhizobium sp. YL-MeA3-2017]MDQ0333492.1 uncharacterized protein (DUF2249 family) [Mesorhizobium sp. YL-MeA3-2017]
MTLISAATERVIDVKDVDPRYRHTIIQQLVANLAPGATLQLVVDHDPKPLRFQLEAKHGAHCQWTYLEQGPDIWRVRLQLRASPGD